MRNIKNMLARFMYGRYGVDQLYYALFVMYIAIMIANTFIRSYIVSILMWVVLLLILFRIFSRNIAKRRAENEKFLKIWNKIKAKSTLPIRRIKEIKTHRYRKCPSCKAVLRLPRRKGKLIAKCPRCSKEFKVHILF